MANFFDQYDAQPPAIGVPSRAAPAPEGGAQAPAPANAFDKFDSQGGAFGGASRASEKVAQHPPPEHPGVLANAPDDTTISSVAKGAGTAAIQGAADVPGIVGNFGNLTDYLMARAQSAITGRPVADIEAEHAAMRQEQKQHSRSTFGFAAPDLPSGDQLAAPVLKQTGQYEPQTALGRAGMMGTRAVTGTVGMGGGLASAPKAFIAGAAGQGATDITGDPLAGLAVGAVAPELAGKVAGAVAKPVTDYIAPMIPGQQPKLANEMLGKAASNPEVALETAKTAPDTIIPGSNPNLAEKTGDIGLAQATKAAGIADPEFAGRQVAAAGEQNAARAAALEGMVPQGDVMAPSSHLNQQLSKIEAAHDAVLEQLQRQAADTSVADAHDASIGALQQRSDTLNAAIPSNFDPDAQGAQLRGAVEAAGDAARELRSNLYKAVDPDNQLAVVTSQAAQAAKKLKASIDPAVTVPSPNAAPVIDMIANLPEVMPFNKLTQLDSTVTEAMSSAKRAGDYTGHAQLSQLKSAVMDAINNAADRQHAWEQAQVASGKMAPSDSMQARFSELDKIGGVGNSGRDAGANDIALAAGEAPTRAPANVGEGLAGGEGQGGLRASAGDQAIPSSEPGSGAAEPLGAAGAQQGASGAPKGGNATQPSPQPTLTPNFDEAAAQRLTEAKAAHAEYAQTYREGPVKGALATTGFKGQYKAPGASIPAKAFPAGNTGYAVTGAFLKAAKNSPEAVSSLQEIASARLRAKMGSDESLTPAKLDAWKREYSHALRAIDEVSPGFSKSFDNAAAATEALANAKEAKVAALKSNSAESAAKLKEATANKVKALKEAQEGAAGKILGATAPGEVKAQVGTMLRAKDGPTQINAALAKMKDAPAAVEGLQRAGIEHIMDSVANAGTAAGEHFVSGAKLNNLLKTNGDAVEALLGKEGRTNMQRIADDIKRTQDALDNTRSRSGSDTGANVFGKMLEIAKKTGHISVSGAMTLAGVEAMYSGNLVGAAGIATLAGLRAAIGKLRANGISKVNDLYLRGLEDPAVGRTMLEQFLDRQGKPKPGALIRLADAIERSSRMIAPLNKETEDKKRQGHKDGGRVGKSQDFLVNRLVRLFDQAKKQENKTTEPILGAPDEAVVKALALTGHGI